VTDDEILTGLNAAFAGCQRPEHFTDFRHCCECAEHDGVLRARDRDTLSIEDVGNPGWDPLCFASADGLLYYMPALARLALDSAVEQSNWYVPQLIFHLTYEADGNRILAASSTPQRRAVVDLLRHISETRAVLFDDQGSLDELRAAIALWEQP
jgi:hypothetical protein